MDHKKCLTRGSTLLLSAQVYKFRAHIATDNVFRVTKPTSKFILKRRM